MRQLILTLLFSTFLCHAMAEEVIHIASTEGDMTPIIRYAIEQSNSTELKVILDGGVYFCRPDYAFEKYCAITNHGNGVKKILFPMIGYKSISIVGNGSKILCHAHMMPFLFERCESVNISNLTIDWDYPFTIIGEVIATNPEQGWRDLKLVEEGFNWEFKGDKLLFPNIDGFNYDNLGSTLPFDKVTKRVVPGAIDIYSQPTKIEKLPDGNYRFYERLKYYPPIGSLLNSKGVRESDRYAPAFEFKTSNSITIDGVIVHHAPGMGFLFEKSTDITLSRSQVVLSKGSPRVVSSTADATHFANCKGDILIEECRFENMLDDGTNVHGTYVEIERVIDSRKVRVELKHFEQQGFEFTEKGDEIWFIKSPSPNKLPEIGIVAEVKILNERFTEIEFEQDIPTEIADGDILENRTWNPTFTMRGCTIQNHRARNVVLKTPLKTVIEDNYFSGMMSSILFRGELYFWYESGGVEDVLIRNNTFHNVADCGSRHATLYITPRFSDKFSQSEQYDRNIRFIDNTINTSNPKVIWADRVDGLTIKGNDITINDDVIASYPNEPTFDIENSLNVIIKRNRYRGTSSKATLRVDANSDVATDITDRK